MLAMNCRKTLRQRRFCACCGAIVKSNQHEGAEGRVFLRTSAGLIAVIAGVAVCVKAGAPLLIPAAFLVLLLALERPKSPKLYLITICGFIVLAIAVGVTWAIVMHATAPGALLITCGLIFAMLGRLRRPSS